MRMKFEESLQLLKDQQLSMMIFEEGQLRSSSSQRGIKPLYDLYTQGMVFHGDVLLVDRVIGLGAAVIAAALGVKTVWTMVMSAPAHDFLRSRGIDVACEQWVDHIENRERTGGCPVEKIALNALALVAGGDGAPWFDTMMADIRTFLIQIGALTPEGPQ